MIKRNTLQPAILLLVDDDPGDQELTRRGITHGAFRVNLQVASNGEEALDYLFHRGQYSDPASSPAPDLILLDLNMPGLDGREVLERLRANPATKHLAVVILTTSDQEADVLRAYELGCQSFITKPVDIEKLVGVLKDLGEYWFQLVTLPPKR